MKKNVLIVDNDTNLNKINEKILRSSGLVDQLRIIDNGKDAVEFLACLAEHGLALPHIIVFDPTLSDHDGFEFIDELAMFDIPGKNDVELGAYNASCKPSDKQKAIKQLSSLAWKIEENFQPKPFLNDIIQKERDESYKHGGMTVFGKAEPPKKNKPQQLNLF